MNLAERDHVDGLEDSRLWRAKLSGPEQTDFKEIPLSSLRSRLELQGSEMDDVYQSAKKNTWLDCGGQCILEITNPETLQKKLGTPGSTSASELVLLSDLDDTLFDTTSWHGHEQEIIRTHLQELSVEADEHTVQQLYEFSKVFIPQVAEVQTRYTPLLNMILIDQFIRRQQVDGLSASDALVQCSLERVSIQDRINRIGEGALHDYRYNANLFSVLMAKNQPDNYLNRSLIDDLFDMGPDGTDNILRFIITRGKIEGPLGQVYKVHSGDFTTKPSLDMVIYTNDVKINALTHLATIYPQLRSKQMFLYDDNPSEIVPFCEQMEKYGMNPFKLEIIHVRHSQAKRRDKAVVIHQGDKEVTVEPLLRSGYYKQNTGDIPMEQFNEMPIGSKGTIFDHFPLHERGFSQVV